MTEHDRSTGTSAAAPTVFAPVHHVYEPHKAGLPKLVPYFSDVWRRRQFAAETSRAGMRSANSLTFFGQLWLIINPLLLAGVYFLLVSVLSGGSRTLPDHYFSHLCGGLFAFYFVQGCVTSGTGSVIGAGKLVLNTAFPRLLLPLGAVRTAFYRFLPTLPVYLLIHVIERLAHPSDKPVLSWTMLLAPFFVACMAGFGAGLGALTATSQVYFRDTAQFIPYFMRIWLYVSPVLWTIDMAAQHSSLHRFAGLNPLYSILGGYGQLLDGTLPPLWVWAAALGWALVSMALGFGFFISRERDFAVRI